MPNTAPPQRRASLPPLDPMRYAPTPERPLRGKARHMASHMDIQPHWHAWAQLVFSISGAVRVSARGDASDSSYLVPPSRAVWIPPGVVPRQCKNFGLEEIDPAMVEKSLGLTPGEKRAKAMRRAYRPAMFGEIPRARGDYQDVRMLFEHFHHGH